MLDERESRYRGTVSRKDYDNEDLPAGRMKQHHHPGRHCIPWRSNKTLGTLRKNLGRPWSKVYSEMIVETTNPVERQVLDDQIRRYVAQDAYLCVDGRYRSQQTLWRGDYCGNYYVHPTTGVLCHQKPLSHRMNAQQKAERKLEHELMRRGLIPNDYNLITTPGHRYPHREPVDNGFRPGKWKQIDHETFWENREGTWFIHTSILHPKGSLKRTYRAPVMIPRADHSGCDQQWELRGEFRAYDEWTNTKRTASKKDIRDTLQKGR